MIWIFGVSPKYFSGFAKPKILSVLLTGELSTCSLVSVRAGELVGEGDPSLLWRLFNSKEFH